ncbi:MAG TPA: hypothetical protein VMU15_15505 [Anaeromyxobacter sp.]|nr:hypothetical protein [Anaeromyxobacter sp.]
MRTLIRQQGLQAEQDFLNRLPVALRGIFLETSPMTWNPVELQAELYEVAASFLYPESGSVAEMHKVLARMSYSSVYRVFVRIPTVDFIAKRAASVWRSYYDTGEAATENATGTSLDFVVRHFPGLPRALREATTGHLAALLELTRAKAPVIRPPPHNPEAWVWHVTWA